MSATTAVFKREMKSYFGTPLAYVFLAIFLGASAFWMYRSDFFAQGEASMRVFFQNLPLLFAVFAPLVAMRMWSEERRTGTIEMLLTLPIKTREAVMGKFLAGWVFMLIALVLTLPVLFTIAWLGDPELGPVFTGYFGAALLGCGYLAVSSFFSVMTKSQVISFVLSLVACVLLLFIGNPWTVSWLSGFMPDFVVTICKSLSFSAHYDVLQRGMVEIRNILFMLIITAGFLFASVVMLDDRKAA